MQRVCHIDNLAKRIMLLNVRVGLQYRLWHFHDCRHRLTIWRKSVHFRKYYIFLSLNIVHFIHQTSEMTKFDCGLDFGSITYIFTCAPDVETVLVQSWIFKKMTISSFTKVSLGTFNELFHTPADGNLYVIPQQSFGVFFLHHCASLLWLVYKMYAFVISRPLHTAMGPVLCSSWQRARTQLQN